MFLQANCNLDSLTWAKNIGESSEGLTEQTRAKTIAKSQKHPFPLAAVSAEWDRVMWQGHMESSGKVMRSLADSGIKPKTKIIFFTDFRGTVSCLLCCALLPSTSCKLQMLPLTSYQDIEGTSVNIRENHSTIFYMNTGLFPAENSFFQRCRFCALCSSSVVVCFSQVVKLVGFVSDNIFQCSLRAYDKMFGHPKFSWRSDKNLKNLDHIKRKTQTSPASNSTNLGLECICPCSPVVQYRTTWETVAWKHQKQLLESRMLTAGQESISSINSFKDTHGYTVHRKGIVNWINQRALLLQLKVQRCFCNHFLPEKHFQLHSVAGDLGFRFGLLYVKKSTHPALFQPEVSVQSVSWRTVWHGITQRPTECMKVQKHQTAVTCRIIWNHSKFGKCEAFLVESWRLRVDCGTSPLSTSFQSRWWWT